MLLSRRRARSTIFGVLSDGQGPNFRVSPAGGAVRGKTQSIPALSSLRANELDVEKAISCRRNGGLPPFTENPGAASRKWSPAPRCLCTHPYTEIGSYSIHSCSVRYFSIYGKRPGDGRFSWLDIFRYRSVSPSRSSSEREGGHFTNLTRCCPRHRRRWSAGHRCAMCNRGGTPHGRVGDSGHVGAQEHRRTVVQPQRSSTRPRAGIAIE